MTFKPNFLSWTYLDMKILGLRYNPQGGTNTFRSHSHNSSNVVIAYNKEALITFDKPGKLCKTATSIPFLTTKILRFSLVAI